jgi:hypothetical protein
VKNKTNESNLFEVINQIINEEGIEKEDLLQELLKSIEKIYRSGFGKE